MLNRMVATAMLIAVAGAAISAARAPSLLDGHEPGGYFLTFDPDLSAAEAVLRPDRLGEGLFFRDWTKPYDGSPAAAGPQFDAPSCASCHLEIHARLGETTTAKGLLVVKPATVAQATEFGAQLNTSAIDGYRPEVELDIGFETFDFQYPDGQTLTLRSPVGRIDGTGEAGEVVALRATPLIYGWGLLESVDQEMVRHFADPHDENNDGISGEVRMVGNDLAIMGWKGEHTTMESQVATALVNDIGVESQITCCDDLPVEITPVELAALSNYVRQIGVPDRRTLASLRGQHLFGDLGCNQCHIPVLMTEESGDDWNSEQTIWPYSDLLVHDMGEALADPTTESDRREWRTAPLWGIGIIERYAPKRGFLHDARARTIEEAILWHGGEADRSRDAFVNLSLEERQELLAYVRAL